MAFEEENEKYALNWNNHSKYLMKAFRHLYQSSDLVDITLSCEGKFIKAHRIVLSMCSNYFNEVCKEHANLPNLVIVIKDATFMTMTSIMKFIYLGEVQVDKENLTDFLNMAEFLQIKGLTSNVEDECEEPFSEIKLEVEPRVNENEQKRTQLQTRTNEKKRSRDSHSLEKNIPNKKVSSQKQTSSSENEEEDKQQNKKKTIETSGNVRDNFPNIEDILKNDTFFDPKTNPNHECPVCAKAMPNTPSLKKHLQTHLGNTTCQYCKKTFSRTDLLKRHISSIHHMKVK